MDETRPDSRQSQYSPVQQPQPQQQQQQQRQQQRSPSPSSSNQVYGNSNGKPYTVSNGSNYLGLPDHLTSNSTSNRQQQQQTQPLWGEYDDDSRSNHSSPSSGKNIW
jgi:hypothetical protein